MVQEEHEGQTPALVFVQTTNKECTLIGRIGVVALDVRMFPTILMQFSVYKVNICMFCGNMMI